jgi:glycosyltransferase involved in cell wall biosynthesis
LIDGQPLVSVIVTAYNRENFLAEAIKSVLDQDYENTEIIVIDDGSTDKTAEIAKSFGSSIVYAFQQNEGVASAVNHGLRLARGELLAFLDSDDLWQEKTLAKRINPFVLDPEIEIVAGEFY